MAGCSEALLLEVLEERGCVDVASLADALEAHPITVSQHCYELQTDGHVRQVSGGVYAITDDGQEYLERLSD